MNNANRRMGVIWDSGDVSLSITWADVYAVVREQPFTYCIMHTFPENQIVARRTRTTYLDMYNTLHNLAQRPDWLNIDPFVSDPVIDTEVSYV